MTYKIGVNAEAYGGCSVTDALPYIKSAGFDAFFTEWKPDSPVEAWAQEGAKKGLIYQSIHAPFGKMREVWNGTELGLAAINDLKACVDDCSRFDVPLMIIHPFIGFKDHTPTEIGLKLYGEVIEHAEKKGILLGFENVEGEEYLAAIMERYSSSPVVKFCWDTGHEQCYNLGKDMMALYGDRLAGTHFDDNMGCTDPTNIYWTDDLHLLPFDGIVDWRGVMDRIRAHGYTGILTFELTTRGKPGHEHYHEGYAKMSCEEFYFEAAKRARRVAQL